MNYKFIPISKERYSNLVVKNNPSEKKVNVLKSINDILKDVREGEKCSCGEPIWVAASIFSGYSCFTCITGETDASEDYEIDEAINLNKKN